jgi:uncharacterized membrane protein
MEQVKHSTSLLKAFLWRVVGVVILAIITYLFTRSWIQTSIITFLHHFIFLFVFYFHERAWLKWGKITGLKRKIWKMFTYETCLGNLILGAITYAITGNWKEMTAITLTYIAVKHLIYIWNEFLWKEK